MRDERMKELKNRWKAALLCMLFLVAAYKCSSQVSKVRYKNHTSILALTDMKFQLMDGDTAYVFISADSLSSGYNVYLSVTYPYTVDIETSEVVIGLQYGGSRVFPSQEYNACTGTAICLLTEADIEFLKSSPFDFISLDDKYVTRPCVSVKQKRYFLRFFSDYKR